MSARDYAGHSGAHTPGPWVSNGDRVRHKTGRGTDMQAIADVLPAMSQAECEANARLIAAAPDLLAACGLLDAWWLAEFPDGPEGSRKWAGGIGQLSEDTIEIWQQIRAAIAKAEGRS